MTLRPEQKEVFNEAFNILDKWSMVYLALRPRFGKTPISLSLATGRTLFVTTKSAIPGIKKVCDSMGLDGVIITTYGSVHKHIDIYETLIVDEAHSNISKYPTMSKGREKLELIIEKNPKIKIIWLSGTPQIESSSKMFYQLSLSPRHSFRKFKDFYEWFNPKGHYSDPARGGGYGIYGITKYTGSNRPGVDYDNTIDFSDKINPVMIRRGEEEAVVNTVLRYLEAPQIIETGISSIQTKKIFQAAGAVFIADSGASKLSKSHQLSGGSCIDDKGEAILLSYYKAQEVARNHKDTNSCIFYKYVAEKELLSLYFEEDRLYQIESNSTGIDLSYYDEAVIYSLTWSGSTYTQVLSRLVNVNKNTIPNIYIYLTNNTPDIKVFEAVSNKYDFNQRFLKG